MIADNKKAGLLIFVIGWMVLGHSFGLALVMAAGASKELYDWKTGGGTPELMDFIATVAIPVVICLILEYIFRI